MSNLHEAVEAALSAMEEAIGYNWHNEPATVEITKQVIAVAAPFIRADERQRVTEELIAENPPCKDAKYGCHCYFIDPAGLTERVAK